MTTLEKLSRIQGRATCYEMALVGPAGKWFVWYTYARNRHTIYRMLQSDEGRKRITAALLVSGTKLDQWSFAKRAADGMQCGDWRITWTSRTQREAICEGELESVLDHSAYAVPRIAV